MQRNMFSNRMLLVTAAFCTASLLFFAYACNEKLGVVDAEKDFPTMGDISSESISDFGEGYLIGFHGKPDEDLVRGAGGRVIHTYKNFPVIHMQIPEQALKGLERAPGVKFVEPNGIVSTMYDYSSYCPANEYYCAHGKIKTYHLSRIGAQAAWKSSTGEGVRVAILDTGIDGTHKDLKNNLAQDGFTVIFTGSPPSRHWHVDPRGHGTHVAGIAGASGQVGGYTNALAGVAPDVTLVSVRVLNSEGRGGWENIAAGIDWCIDNNIDIINMSLGGDSYSETLDLAVQSAWNAGLLIVASAGNEGVGGENNVGYPAAYEQVIAVSSANLPVDGIATHSSTGPEVELIAPGQAIFSTHIVELGYRKLTGTSMASPFVAGVAALLWSSDASLTNQEVRDRLKNQAEDLGLHKNLQGAGLVRADKALGIEAVHLSGLVSGSGSGDPIFAATLSLEENGTAFSTVTAGDIGYHLFIPPGEYVATVSYPYDFNDVTESVLVYHNGPAVHDFMFSHEGDDDDNGEPPPDDPGDPGDPGDDPDEPSPDPGDPSIDAFTLTNTSNPQFARVRIDWEVSGENLSTVEVVVTGPNNDSRTWNVSGSTASGTHELSFRRGFGTYNVTLTVTDANGNTSETKSITL